MGIVACQTVNLGNLQHIIIPLTSLHGILRDDLQTLLYRRICLGGGIEIFNDVLLMLAVQRQRFLQQPKRTLRLMQMAQLRNGEISLVLRLLRCETAGFLPQSAACSQ